MATYYDNTAEGYRAYREQIDKWAETLTPEQLRAYGMAPGTRYVNGQVVPLGIYDGPGVGAFETLLDIYGPQYQTVFDTAGLGQSPLLEVLAPRAMAVVSAPRGRISYNAGSGSFGSSGGEAYSNAVDEYQRLANEFTAAAQAQLGGSPYVPSSTAWVANYVAQQMGYRDVNDIVAADIAFRKQPNATQTQNPIPTPATTQQAIPDSQLLADMISKLGSTQQSGSSDLTGLASLMNSSSQQSAQLDPYAALVLNRLGKSYENQPGLVKRGPQQKPEAPSSWGWY